ncbi:MAG: hypothetical protein JRI75_11465, partial [Deltaproteobacteria bacterium]|nr:hypothetical protein [Deltaproteobacteria bacterium]
MVKKKKPSPKKKKPALPPKRKGPALWLGLIFFVSIWMFILGIFVGRGTIPVQFDIEKLHKELATLKAEFIKKEQDRFNSPGDQTGNKTELRFYEVLKKARSEDKLDTEIISKPATGPLPETADTDEKKTGAAQGSETTGALQGSETTGAPLKSETNVAEKKPAIKTDSEHPRAMKP